MMRVFLNMQFKLFLTDTTDEILDGGDLRDKDSLQLFEQPVHVAPAPAIAAVAQPTAALSNSHFAAPAAAQTSAPASLAPWTSSAAHYSFGYDSAPEPAPQGIRALVDIGKPSHST